MVGHNDDFANAVEIIPGKFYFVCIKRPECISSSQAARGHLIFEVDSELLFEPFFADFGPLNFGKTYRYCQKVISYLAEGERTKKKVFHYCGPHVHSRANAAVLVGVYQVIYLNRTADDAYKLLLPFKPFVPFRDASCGPSTFHLTVLDCMRGMQKGRDVGFIDWNSGNSTWSLEEYEHFEQVENGDLNWILPGKLLAFSGPAARGNEIPGYRLFTPEDYWDYYKKRNVTSVVRLNKKLYDRKRFTDGGIRHYDLFFPDGTCPTEAIILKFLEMAENEPGAIAIHCKAGLGRTGILILCFLMKHYRFTTEEAIGYIRLARPGSVIGPQQNFMREVEQWMWHEGDLYRQKMGLPKDHLGHLGGTTELSLQGHIPAGNATVSSPKPSSGPPSHHGAHRLSSDYAAPGTASSDMSLMQYRQHSGATAAGSHPPHVAAGSGASAVASLSRGTSRSTGATGFATRLSTSPLKLQENNISPQHFSSPPDTPLAFSNMTRKNGASPTPMVTRSMPSMPTRGQPTGRQGSASSLRATLHTDTVLNADRPKIGVPERSAQSAVGAPGGGWAISANGQKVVAQSTYSMRNGHSRQSPAGYKSGTPNSHGIARTLAPNGQPRKIPMTMLSQYHARMVGGSTGLGGMGMVVGTPVSTSLDSGTGRGGVKTPAQLRYGMRTK